MGARFKIDEDLPGDIAAILRAASHDAMTVAEQSMLGWPDDRVWQAVVSEHRTLITADVGFSDARRVVQAPQSGIILLRLPRESRRGYIALVSELVSSGNAEQHAGCVVTVTPTDVRIHDTRFRG